MDLNNRLAFIKIVWNFERNKPYYHVRLKKNLKFSSRMPFAEEKEIVDISYPGICRSS
jgi:peptide chain release factor 3